MEKFKISKATSDPVVMDQYAREEEKEDRHACFNATDDDDFHMLENVEE